MPSKKLLTLFALFAFQQSSFCQFSSGLTAYWPLDKTLEDKAAKIKNSADLVADDFTFQNSGASFDRGFLGDGGFVSNGKGYAQANDSIDINGKEGVISISVWIKSLPNPKYRWWEAIFSKGEEDNFRLHRYKNSTAIAWSSGGSHDIHNKDINISDGKWHHITSITTPDKLRLYIDGVLAASKSGVFKLGSSNTPLQLGSNPEAKKDSRVWRGQIDDLAIWNRELTSSEVKEIYEAGLNNKALSDLFSTQKTVNDDNDGLDMNWEIQYGLEYEGISGAYGDDGADGDPDGDNLANIKEQELGTNPTLADTDGDGFDDGEEVKTYKTSPLKADTDGDGFDDRREKVLGSDPNNSKSTPVSN